MLLRLAHFKLNAYVVLVLSKQKGITLVFKTDPLQNVDVSSTFDSIAVIQKFIQREIEGQLREMFREDLPGIIHRLSQRWVAGRTKVEAPYLSKLPLRQNLQPPSLEPSDTTSNPEMHEDGRETRNPRLTMPNGFPHYIPTVGLHPVMLRHPSFHSNFIRTRPSHPPSTTSATRRPASDIDTAPRPAPSLDGVESSFPDIENFDPTYGLRPDGLPAKSGYSGLGRLWTPSRGLGDLNEEGNEPDEVESFDIVSWIDAVPEYPAPDPSLEGEDPPLFESIPAVGGGTITRPRVFHSQSLAQPPPGVVSPPAPRPLRPSSSVMYTPDARRQAPRSLQRSHSNPYFALSPHQSFENASQGVSSPVTESVQAWRHNSVSPTRSISPTLRRQAGLGRLTNLNLPSAINHTLPTPPSSEQPSSPVKVIHRNRSPSLGGSGTQGYDGERRGSPPPSRYLRDENGGIILRPGLNSTVSQLSTLSHNNHTLSPYTRSVEHFTVRSVPPRPPPEVPAQPVRAKRKRIYRVGKGKKDDQLPPEQDVTRTPSPAPPSEFSDVDHYFRSGSGHATPAAAPAEPIPASSLRRRLSYQDL